MVRAITLTAALMFLSACMSNTTLSDTLAAGVEPLTIDELLENGESYNQQQVWVRGFYYSYPGMMLCINKTTLAERRQPEDTRPCIGIAYTITSIETRPQAKDGEEIALEVRYSQMLCNKENPCIKVSTIARPERGYLSGRESSAPAIEEEQKDSIIRFLGLLDPPGSEQQAK